MKANIIKAQNLVVRFSLEVPKRDVVLVSKMPLEKNPFVLQNEKGEVTFSLRFSTVSSINGNVVTLALPANDAPDITVNVSLGDGLTEDQVKFLTAHYTDRLSQVEAQIKEAVKNIQETIKKVEVL